MPSFYYSYLPPHLAIISCICYTNSMSHVRKKYAFAVIATDIIIFTVEGTELKTLLIQMGKKPFGGMWAFPGGLVRPNESVLESAKRHLQEKAGIKNVYLEQLYTFGRINRDPFGRVVSVAYMALIPPKGISIKTTKEYEDIRWFSIKKLPPLAYDHKEMAMYALSRLRAKLEYTNIVHNLLHREFTLSDLQEMYEIILAKKLDKRNFRKKIISLGLIKKLSKKTAGTAGRPATLFTFTQRAPTIVDILS